MAPSDPNFFEFGIHKPNFIMSIDASYNDAVIRSDNNIMFQSGTQASALYIAKSNNRVGIANSSPSEILDVIGYTKSSSGYKTGSYGRVIDSSGNFTGDNGTLTGNLTVDTNTLYVHSSQSNVGIGTTEPGSAYKLHVLGDTRIQGNLTVNGTTTVINTNVAETSTEQLIITNDGTGPAVVITQTGNNDIFKILDDANTCFFIKDGGKILIGGISESTYHLDISGNTHFVNNVDVSQNVNVSGNAKVIGSLTCGSMQIDGNFGVKGNFDLSENFRILTNKFTITPTGNVGAAGTLDVSSNLTVLDKFRVTAASGNTDMSGNLTVNVDKFKVIAASGNVGAAGTIDVSGNLTINTDQFKITAATGNTDMSGNLTIRDKFQVTSAGQTDMSGNLTVNVNKFKVIAASGNVGAAGTFDVSGNLTVIDKFRVTAATGNTDMSGNLTVNLDQFKVTAATGNTDMSGNLTIRDKFQVTSAGQIDMSGNLTVNVDKFQVIAASGNTDIKGTLSVAGNLAIDTNVLFVDVSNNMVGINDATPEHALDVNGSIAINNAIIYNDISNNGLFANRSNNNATDYAIKQSSTGLTTINCKTGAGNIKFTHGNSTTKQEFDSDGNVIIQGNLFSYSDARIKTNIETIVNALDKVTSIRGVTYNMIKDIEIDPENAQKHIGVIAQEIESVIPEAVKEENGIKTVAYGNIVGLLIEAIKELKDQIKK
jgi:hypothetical protein